MNENRRQILEMLAEGKINADEAERLIAALETEAPAAPGTASSEAVAKANPKYLRILVKDESMGDHPTQVNVRVPMQLLRAGVRLAGLIPAQARDHVNEALREQGIQFDISQIKPENLEELVNELSDLTVDVDNEQTKVRVFCE
jgi:hypothetical protein